MKTVILTYRDVHGYRKGTHHDGLVTILDGCRRDYSDVPVESLKDFSRVVIYLGGGHTQQVTKDMILRLRDSRKRVVLTTCPCSESSETGPTPGLDGFRHRWVECGGHQGLRQIVDQIIGGDI